MKTDAMHLDLETRSAVDLRKAGLFVYAADPTTEVLCAAYAFGDDATKLWLPGEPCPERVRQHVARGGEVWAHNATFERELVNAKLVPQGWPKLEDIQLVCTMAMAYAMALPASLAGASAALGVQAQKDLSGQRVMLKLCRPRQLDPILWWEDAADLKKLYDYCRQDVEVERAIGHRMVRLSTTEDSVWRLDQRINRRGLKIDIPAALSAMEIAVREKQHLDAQMRKVTENRVATCNATAQLKTFVVENSVEDVDGVAKADITELLGRENLPRAVREALLLRREAGKATVAKLDPMVFSANADHRVRGCFQYSGANTRRWAGRRVQFQNLKRSDLKPEEADVVLSYLAQSGCQRDEFEMLFGPPLSALANAIRGFIVPAKGHEFLVCDFSAIEARVLAWLAGQESTLQGFRDDRDVYVAAAQEIFGETVISSPQRQIGKVATLALGYGGGVGALQTMARGYGVKLEPAFDALWALATPDERDAALASYAKNGKKYEIPKKEYLASELTKVFWRQANQNVVAFWRELEHCVERAMAIDGVFVHESGRLKFRRAGSFLWVQLPSGGKLCYPYPEMQAAKTPWGATVKRLTYMSEGVSRKWERFGTYGGSLAENLTQAVARDLLAEAMLRLEEHGYPIVLHAHDEACAELPVGEKRIEDMARIMCEAPLWATGLPLAAAGFKAKRYRK